MGQMGHETRLSASRARVTDKQILLSHLSHVSAVTDLETGHAVNWRFMAPFVI
jgi:hypothetical protein